MNRNRTIRFSEQDLDLFSRASGDCNPLHLSTAYASRTAYGQQVVFGALGCLASLGPVKAANGSVVRVVADFQRPMFLNVNYRLEWTESRDSVIARLFDGSTPVLTITIRFSPEERVDSPLSSTRKFPLDAARVLRWEDLTLGLGADGDYRADPEAMRELYARWSLEIDPGVAEALLWSSYFIGMELPGQNALFFRAALDFHGAADPNQPLRFRTKIVNLNQALAQIRTAVELSSGDQVAVTGQLTSFVRPEMASLRLSESDEASGHALAGKVGIVVGASRGLGAALAMKLAAEGASVIALSRSDATWASEMPSSIRERLTLWTGDASDLEALGKLGTEVSERFGRLDFLVCSAFPAIPSLRLEPDAASRIQDYLDRATKLVLNPLCVFLPELSRSRGCTVLISSAAVEDPVRDWPHYVAAKSAVEAFCRLAPLQFPETSTLIVRPERLLTEMTNTPMGRKGATPPMALASQIGQRLRQPPRPGTTEMMDLRAPLKQAAQALEEALSPANKDPRRTAVLL